MNERERNRRAAIAELRRRYRIEFGKPLTDSEARACFRGECSTAEYRLAYNVAREYGLE